ncbi:amino acid ABC transporter substrate-binding protein [bacterium BFN5]|nr:amino acid ABC transporter substrate-binding protein [bacterium BFN5]
MPKNKPCFISLVILMLVLYFLSGCGSHILFHGSNKSVLEKIKARGHAVAAVSVYPPFVYFDERSQQFVGSDIMLAKAIAARIGVPLVIKEVQFTSLIPAVQNGQADFAVGALYITQARKALINFSQPYFETGIIAVSRREQVQNTESFTLNGKVIGVKAGGTSAKVADDLRNTHRNLIIKSYRDSEDALQDLESGQIDVVLNDLVNQLEYNKLHPNLVIVGDRLTIDALGVAVLKDNEDFLQVINSVITDLGQVTSNP